MKDQPIYTQAMPPKELTIPLEVMRESMEQLKGLAAGREWVLISPSGLVYADTDVSKLIGVLAEVHLKPKGF